MLHESTMSDELIKADKIRLDQLLVERGLFPSRSRARDAVVRGTISVNGKTIKKAGHLVAFDEDLMVRDPAQSYVSRAALKLKAAIEHFGLDINGRTALDIGASTGGFTQVLLEQGAVHVIAIDVGHDQLHDKLKSDPRVTNYEGVNARYLNYEHLGNRLVDCVVSDVSFISLKLALPPALSLAAPESLCILLVKPQFEAGREAIGKGGLLKDPDQGLIIAESFVDWLNSQSGWRALGICASPIEGSDGNIEYLLAGIKDQ